MHSRVIGLLALAVLFVVAAVVVESAPVNADTKSRYVVFFEMLPVLC